MTTPERFRRRQRIEAALLVLMAIGFILQNRYFNHLNEQSRACLADNFSALATNLTARSEIASAEARTTRAESRANRQFYRDAFASESEAEVFDAYAAYRIRIEKIDQRRDRIAQERADNPIPAFPAGSCD